jgi:hypothetical protein
MSIEINTLAQQAVSGHFQQAAASAAQERFRFGSDIDSARAMARRASSTGDGRLLALAWALCPEAQTTRAAAFLSGLSTGQSRFCLAQSALLRENAWEQARLAQQQDAEREAQRRRASEAKGRKELKTSKETLACKVQAVVSRKRAPRKLDIAALKAFAASQGKATT